MSSSNVNKIYFVHNRLIPALNFFVPGYKQRVSLNIINTLLHVVKWQDNGACTSCITDIVPDHGGWGKWMSFSGCSVSCGGGTHTRQRQCDSPSPAYGGDYCSGNENETQWCNTDVCPGKH